MIQFAADNIDQLDLALDQLAVRDRNFDRFALMLVDNVVELTMHNYIQELASENEMWGRIGTPKHDPQAIEKSLGRHFDSKARGASKLGLFDEATCEAVLNLHAFRNTAYHSGRRHEGILHTLAVRYFKTACDILAAYKPRGWSWSSTDTISYRARKYIGDPRHMSAAERFSSAYARLREVVDSLGDSLIRDLSVDLSSTITRMDDLITFLANDGPRRMTRDQVVVDCQAWPFAFTDEAKEFAQVNGYRSNAVGPFVDWIATHYPWPFSKDPIPSWRSRCESLENETDEHKALKKYSDFMRQTEEIRSAISEAAELLDRHIQHQIDLARGK